MEFVMKTWSTLLATATLAAGVASFAAPAGAAPLTLPSSLRNAVTAPVETVQWRRRWLPGVAAGAVIGGATAASRYGYDSYDAYAYSPGYSYGTGYSGYSNPGYSGYSNPGYSGYAYSPGYSGYSEYSYNNGPWQQPYG